VAVLLTAEFDIINSRLGSQPTGTSHNQRNCTVCSYQRIGYEDRHSGKSASNSLESLERKSGEVKYVRW